MALSKKYRDIEIRDSGDEYDGRPVYEVVDNPTEHRLGEIHYHASWGRYVFEPSRYNVILDDLDLRDVLDFMALIKED